MINFFKRIRKNVLSEGEIVLVVIGILKLNYKKTDLEAQHLI